MLLLWWKGKGIGGLRSEKWPAFVVYKLENYQDVGVELQQHRFDQLFLSYIRVASTAIAEVVGARSPRSFVN